ncbi:MAG: RNA-binding protein [Nitrospirota bacterium]
MSKKIYVGNLPYSATEDDLRQMFEKVGEVQSVRILTDAATGRSRGFGFVEMTSDEEADKAINQLNGAALMERTLTVSEARPQAARGKGDDRGRKRKSFDEGRKTGRWR